MHNLTQEHQRHHLKNDIEHSEILKSNIDTILRLGSVCIQYAQVERVPRYVPYERENDAEHSVMLAVIATELAQYFRPGQLDLGRVSQFSVIHDMVEIIVGDTPTFHTSEAMLKNKAEVEHAALDTLLAQLPPQTRRTVMEYESQVSSEAIWVKAVDKLLAVIVDIEGCGVQIMVEDYGITSTSMLIIAHQKLLDSFIRRFGETCPELIPLYRDLMIEFERRFEATTSISA